MPLKIISGTLDIQSDGISCRLDDGVVTVACTISRFVLQDLAGRYLAGVGITELQAFGELISEIENLATAKFDSGRLDENGDISIGTSDFLRHRRLFEAIADRQALPPISGRAANTDVRGSGAFTASWAERPMAA
jgi:hypothetical protein